MIFQRPLLLSINKNAVQRRKHPARNERYGFPITLCACDLGGA